jgi:hypothetical protein
LGVVLGIVLGCTAAQRDGKAHEPGASRPDPALAAAGVRALNLAPHTPSTPNPADGEANVPVDVELQ